MSTTVEINREGLSALSISDLILWKKELTQEMSFCSTAKEQQIYAEKITTLYKELKRRDESIFII